MKQIALLIAIAWPAFGLAQAPPENPPSASTSQASTSLPEAPTPPPASGSAMWDRVEHLPRGEKIKINYGRGPWDRCRFAGATDQYLFCEPGEDSDRAQEYQIDRFSITDFKIDHDVRNGRLIYTGVMLGTGLALGIRASQTNAADPEAAGIIGGLLGTGLGALVGVPFSCLSGHCVELHLPPPSPPPMAYGIGINLPLRVPMHRR